MQAGIDVTTEAAVKNIYAANGVPGFFSGAAALALRDLPFDVIQFPIYEYLKVALARQLRRPLQTWELAFCGFLAGGIAAALTTPLDVVKTRYLTQPKLYNGMLTCFLTVWRQEGAKGLFAGVGPRLAIIALGGAIYFGVYEAVKQALQPKPEVYAAASSSPTPGISSASSSTSTYSSPSPYKTKANSTA
jgi:solute carrier family 25 S-adenosylmethionine transporter 26